MQSSSFFYRNMEVVSHFLPKQPVLPASHIYERKNQLGADMPNSHEGANTEHVTNISGNEIPELVTPVSEWLQSIND